MVQIKCWFFFLAFRRKLQPFPTVLAGQVINMLEMPNLGFRGLGPASLECSDVGQVWHCCGAVRGWGLCCCSLRIGSSFQAALRSAGKELR